MMTLFLFFSGYPGRVAVFHGWDWLVFILDCLIEYIYINLEWLSGLVRFCFAL